MTRIRECSRALSWAAAGCAFAACSSPAPPREPAPPAGPAEAEVARTPEGEATAREAEATAPARGAAERDGAPAAPPKGPGGWTMFQGEPGRAGAATVPPIEEPRLRWKAKVGVQSWLNGPLVAGGTVVVPSSGKRHNMPDPGDGVYALRLRDGSRLWHAHFDGDANGAAVHGERVIATSDDGRLYALELGSGGKLWDASGKGKVYTHPLVVGDRVIVGDERGWLRALALSDGAEQWSVQLTGAIRGGAAADAEHVYAVSQGGEAVALAHDGEIAWRVTVTRPPFGGRGRPVPIEAYSTPILEGERVIIPFARNTTYRQPALIALDRSDGSVIWRARGAGSWGNIRSTPALAGGTLIYSEPYSGDVVGVEAQSGKMRFRKTIDACFFPQWASPASAGDVVYVPRFSGTLFAIEADTGQVLWRLYLGDVREAGGEPPPPLRPGGRNCAWKVPQGWPLYAPAALAADGTLLAGSEEGYLYAIEDGGD